MTSDRWLTIERLYHEALALQVEDRATFLTDACASDDSLRDEVESLLAHDGQAAFLSTPAAGGQAPAISIGQRLGPYVISAPLGAGGMGEVYKARDTRLDRTVAIKVLSAQFADDPQFRERFDREARAVAALNHPHICTLHDVGDQDGTAYLVMEYLEGETLVDRLKKGALPLDQALRHAIAIADALDKAHCAGIVHRDLKPGNIMLTKSGAKLLDFGLAKTDAPGVAGGGLSMLSTRTPSLTARGTLLGTFQYMAPEQLEGQKADARTDLFAFGAVLYEMLTGKKAFEGRSQASLSSAIMSSDPRPISALQPLAPALLERVVSRCLAKDPTDRWQTARDLGAELQWIAAEPSDPHASSLAGSRRRANRLTWVVVAVVMLAAVAAATGIAVWMLKPEPPRAARRFAVVLPEGNQLTGDRTNLAVSPDATHLVYGVSATNVLTDQLYLRAMDQLTATPIQGAIGTTSPFFSPDGQWIGFWQNNRLKKVSITGGAAVDLCDTPMVFGASWTSDGTILFGRGPDGIWQVSDGGGQASRRIAVDPKKQIAFGPQMLPGGKAVLFNLASQPVAGSTQSVWDNAEIVVESLESGKRTVVVRGGAHARYVATGHLVYVRQGTLLALPFDLARNSATGNPVPMVDGIRQAAASGSTLGFGGTASGAPFTVSENGLFAYRPTEPDRTARTLVWVDRQGRETTLQVPDRAYVYPRISPDRTRIALDIRDQQQGIWTWDLNREIPNRVTSDPAADISPLWTPDGRRIVFSKQGQGLFVKSADGTGAEERLTTGGSDGQYIPNAFSHDGTRLVFADHPPQGYDLRIFSLDDKRVVDLIAQPMVDELNADISPDGRWLAYQSNESGQAEIYVRPFPDVQSGKVQISRAGGTRPVWARSGHELFYLAGGRSSCPTAFCLTLMVTPIDSSAGVRAGNPLKLFSGPYLAGFNNRTYDVSANGQQFLMIKAAGPAANYTERIIVVENWFEQLKHLVPATR